MPDIDVTDLLSDPDIAGDEFTVKRRQETVNTFGRSVVATVPLDACGPVFPAGDNSLIRQDAFDAEANTITVVTEFRLRGPSKSGGLQFKADLVEWPRQSGNHYIVRTTNDFSRYGAGMIEAECTSIDFSDEAPEEAE